MSGSRAKKKIQRHNQSWLCITPYLLPATYSGHTESACVAGVDTAAVNDAGGISDLFRDGRREVFASEGVDFLSLEIITVQSG
jgi:hypothetical protein